MSSDGSNLYVGAGTSLFIAILCCADASGGGGFVQAHGLLGWEAPINSEYMYFFEAAPGIRTDTGEFFARISLGLRAHRSEFLNRR